MRVIDMLDQVATCALPLYYAGQDFVRATHKRRSIGGTAGSRAATRALRFGDNSHAASTM